MKSKFLSAALSVSAMITSTCFAQQPGATTAEEPVRYSMILSLKSGPADHDVMVVRNQGNLYSFKYCRAFDKAPVPEVAKIRKDYFQNPNNYSGGNETQKIAAHLFESPACRTIGKEVYGIRHDLLIEHASKVNRADSLYGMSLTPAGLSVLGSFYFFRNYAVSRSAQNSTAFWRFVLSKQFPRGSAAITLSTAAIFATIAYSGYSAHKEDTAINAKIEQENALQDDLDISLTKPRVATVDSMAEFGNNFLKGLNYAVALGWFVEM